MFGFSGPKLRNAANVGKVVAAVREVVSGGASAPRELVAELARCSNWFGGDDAVPRLITAKCVAALAESVTGAEDKHVVSVLAAARCETSAEAMGTSFKKADGVRQALRQTHWHQFEAIQRMKGKFEAASRQIMEELTDTLSRDEFAVGLATKIRVLEDRAARTLSAAIQNEAGEDRKPQVTPPPGRKQIGQGKLTDADASAAEQAFKQIRDKMSVVREPRVTFEWRVIAEEAE